LPSPSYSPASQPSRLRPPRAPRAACRPSRPAALIDFGAIFGGDEDESDENETDDGEQQQQQPASERPAPGSNISLALVLLIAVLGVLAAAFVVNRLRRLWARVRDLSAQASARVREWSGGS
jgi:hypothetical protein